MGSAMTQNHNCQRHRDCPALVAHRGQDPQLQLPLAPGSENEPANRESNKWAAHVNENQRLRIRFKRRERRDGCVLNKQKAKEAD
jgi:hypothetical protein